MGALPKKVVERLSAGIKKFQPILAEAHKRDVNESDTVTIVTDLLSEVLGYEKYGEITSEHSIRGTFCDIALKVNGELAALIEIKAIGLDLKDSHAKQAVDYAANQGCDWVVLTNGVNWHASKVTFTKPIQADLVLDLNLLEISHRRSEDLALVALLARESWQKSRLEAYALQKQALSRFTVAAVLLSEPCVAVVRRQLKRLSRDIRIDSDQVTDVLVQEVIKREAVEGERAEVARRLVSRSSKRARKAAVKSQPAAKTPAKPA